MMEIILSLLSGPNSLLAGLAAALAVVIAAFFKGRSTGKRFERAKQTEAIIKSQDDLLEMNREATVIERRDTGLTDAEARAKAGRRFQ